MKIAALISGGVDSAVAVHRLVEQGHDLTLFYIRIGLDNGEGDCSAEEDMEMCTAIARRYGLPLHEVSLHEEYWENVMEYALRTVKAGLTPNPDLMCNRMIKFGFFEQRWGHEFDLTATGHYATTIIGDDGLKYLATAVDPVKDQTDFLARITYDQLRHLIFPIGDIPKAEVREIAIREKLPNAFRKDSQGICFLGKINYNDFLRRHLGEKDGPIIEIETGKKIGIHHGYWFHTIGQRKGLGLSGGPWYVVKKNIHDNAIYVSRGYDTEKQYGRQIRLTEPHFITCNPWETTCGGAAPRPPQEANDATSALPHNAEIKFKNRHSPEFFDARISLVKDASDGTPAEYIVETDKPVQGIAPGQFGILYDRDARICYGSGIITL